MQLAELSTLSSILGVLTALIAPALLISASGTLILSTSNRLARVIDRVRKLSEGLETRVREQPVAPLHAERTRLMQEQLVLLARRTVLLQRSLMQLYGAAGSFVASSLLLGVEAFTGVLPNALPVLLALLGALVLLGACVTLVLETRVQVGSLRGEMGYLSLQLQHLDAQAGRAGEGT